MVDPSALEGLFNERIKQFEEEIATAHDEMALRVVRAKYINKETGIIRSLFESQLAAAPGPQKRAVGQLGNLAVKRVEDLFNQRLGALHEAARQADLLRHVDVTLPGRGHPIGGLHLLTQVRRELEEIFAEIGFTVATGPQVETDFYNFEALAMPKDHPARDMQDTFYLQGGAGTEKSGELLVLRTHTSPVQIRTMLAHKPPIRIFAPGKVYRKDDDPTHSPMFQQIEGLVVDEGVSFADLKGTLQHFVRRFFGAALPMRFRASFFPFTEPSAEVDMQCQFCRGGGCRVCKHTGWVEILGCGMVDPEVFRHVGYDSERYSGFAFGTGLERMAMLRYGISDLRLFFAGDARFTQQFR